MRRNIRSDMLIPDYKIPNTSLCNEKKKVNLEINNKVFKYKLVLWRFDKKLYELFYKL